jgi:hypothetical protein
MKILDKFFYGMFRFDEHEINLKFEAFCCYFVVGWSVIGGC